MLLLGSGRSDLRDPGGGGEEGLGLLREGQVRRRTRERRTQGKAKVMTKEFGIRITEFY